MRTPYIGTYASWKTWFRLNLKTAIKRKDAKHAEECKRKNSEAMFTELVIVIFELSP